MISTKSPVLWEQIQETYKEKDKQVKNSIKGDKRDFVESVADKA